MDGADSPPFSPVSFVIERPNLSPSTYSELRRSCAAILQELQPTDHHVYESISDRNKYARKWSDDNRACKSTTQAPASKARDHRRTDSAPNLASKPYTHIPTHAAISFEATASSRRPSQAVETSEQTHNTTIQNPTSIRSKTQAVPECSLDPITHIRADLGSRPRTSAPACIDYKNTSNDSSNSTTRSNTTYEKVFGGLSTGMTSLALTPGSQRRASHIPNDGTTASAAAATATAWMAQELARRRSEAENATHRTQRDGVPATIPISTLGPSTRASVSDHHTKNEEILKPRSRSASISQGIKEYIRPRGASIDSVRSTQSNLSRAPSKSSGNGNNKWWSGAALRRKGSWSSFRSDKVDKEANEASEGSGGGTPDLNRALPKLPGLETYREERPAKMHISQLMRPGTGARKTADKQETAPPPGRPGATGHDDSSRRRATQMQKSFEERTRRNAGDEKVRAGPADPDAFDGHHAHPLPRPQPASGGEKNVRAIGVTECEKEKKRGLREKLSRIWGGRGRGRGGVGLVVVEAN